ncbi:hypothetical protein BD311DRAFT_498284 [Dichomitus squalens]|uniref:Uncharacterized protein n=1 Tax=Dichomitus squalens TaxID=114155 RepID=A0A4Q9MDM4_9APHY|nr:hypothetical protein BD311DRAFT_498284 [Dichomitus squalens]
MSNCAHVPASFGGRRWKALECAGVRTRKEVDGSATLVVPHMDSNYQTQPQEEHSQMPMQSSVLFPVATQLPHVYATQPTSVFDGPVVVMPVSHYLGAITPRAGCHVAEQHGCL